MWLEPGSNWRPHTFQACALPTELSSQNCSGSSATLTGLEPATSAVTGRRANQLRHRAIIVLSVRFLQCIHCVLHCRSHELIHYTDPVRASKSPAQTPFPGGALGLLHCEVPPGLGPGVRMLVRELPHRSRSHHLATSRAGAWAEVDDVVRARDQGQVVIDDDDFVGVCCGYLVVHTVECSPRRCLSTPTRAAPTRTPSSRRPRSAR